MIWKVNKKKKYYIGYKKPSMGDIKVVKRFAIFPKRLKDSDYVIWLEKYEKIYEYRSIHKKEYFFPKTYNKYTDAIYYHIKNGWVLIDEKLIKNKKP